nr:uncharacterized protein LOC123494449 [Aegilops tauschii subsp. strangulata]
MPPPLVVNDAVDTTPHHLATSTPSPLLELLGAHHPQHLSPEQQFLPRRRLHGGYDAQDAAAAQSRLNFGLSLDRKKLRKIKDWAKHHSKYVVQFALSVEQARAGKRAQLREHCPIAFNNYLTWFLASTRVEVCQPAYAEEILEEPTVFDEVAQHQYNALVRKGNSVIPSAPMMNFVRAQIKKAADETETILETTPAGKSDGEKVHFEHSLRFTSPSN